MHRIIVFLLGLWLSALAWPPSAAAQAPHPVSSTAAAAADSVFRGRIYNKENHVYIVMDFYRQNILVPDAELFGELPGYFGDTNDYRKWLFTSAELVTPHQARLAITNDYGSEDLTATLTYNPADSTFTLEQGKGSNIKIAVNRKFVKIPQKLEFKRQR